MIDRDRWYRTLADLLEAAYEANEDPIRAEREAVDLFGWRALIESSDP